MDNYTLTCVIVIVMVGILFFIKRQIVIVMECEVMCNTGSITWPLHDCAFSIKAFIIPHAAYRLGNMSIHCN